MENRGRKRLSTVVTAAASSSTVNSAKEPASAGNVVVEKKKPGRKPLAVTAAARKRSTSPPKPKPSPAKKASPGRRASPARKASPSRKMSPSRKASPGRKPRVATATTTTATKPVEPPKISPEEPRRSERIRASEEKVDRVQLALKKSPIDKRLSVIMDDAEVSGIMSGGRSSADKSMTPTISQRSNAITPTTERSRVTITRSMSVLQDYSDNEDNAAFLSFRRSTNGVFDKSQIRRNVLKSVKPQLVEFGGGVGAAALLIILPLYMFLTNHFCSGVHRDCQFVLPKSWAEFSSLGTYLNREAAMFYGTFVFGVALLTGLPIGKQVTLVDESHEKRVYTFNGVCVAFGGGLGVFVAMYCYKYPLVSIVSRGYNQLLVLSLMIALVAALVAFLRSYYVESMRWNPFAKTGNTLADFFAGREIEPIVQHVFNLKLIAYHVSLGLALLFNGIILYRNLHFAELPDTLTEAPLQERLLYLLGHLSCEPVPVAASGLIVLYLVDLLLFEHHMVASFEVQQEGFGAQFLLRQAAFPFALTLLPKYVAAHKLSEVPLWAIAVCVLVALAGLFVKRLSMRLKYLYRLNPLGEQVACLETYPTFQGRRLLVAKWWRMVRQPNYVGDILQNVALLPLLYWRFAWPPLLAVLFTVGVLVHRAKRLNQRNSQKYDSSWHRYCNTVTHLLIPRVY